MRKGGFSAIDEPLDEGGEAKTLAARGRAFEERSCSTSPALAARQTAAMLEIDASVDDALRDLDHGDWTGRLFADVHASSPDAFARWIEDPASGAPGGEPLALVRDRMVQWLADRAKQGGPLLAITHPMVIRAAIAIALDIPSPATLRVDVAPLSITRLSWNGVWRLQTVGGR
jgi:broad specificity phosphatase PhoE